MIAVTTTLAMMAGFLSRFIPQHLLDEMNHGPAGYSVNALSTIAMGCAAHYAQVGLPWLHVPEQTTYCVVAGGFTALSQRVYGDVMARIIEREASLSRDRELKERRIAHITLWPKFGLWIIAHPDNENLAWSGRSWVPIGGDTHICNFRTEREANEYAQVADFGQEGAQA